MTTPSNFSAQATIIVRPVMCILILLLSLTAYTQAQDSTLKTTLDSLDNIRKKAGALNDISNKLKTENQSYRKSIDSLKRIKTATAKQAQKLREVENKLQVNNDSLKKVNAALEFQKAEFEAKIAELKKDVAAFDTILKRLKSDTAQLNKDTAQLHKEEKEMQENIETGTKTLEKQQALIAKQLDSLEVIGHIDMGDSLIIYTGKNDSVWKTKTRIKEVNITVREGIILELVVKTERGTFRNKKGIIDLLHLGERAPNERLQIEHQRYVSRQYDNAYIYLDDAITYHVTRSYNDIAYGDFDIHLLPSAGDSSYLLRESTSINTYFDVAAFTDLKGLGGDANGLAQFTAEAKFITNTSLGKRHSTIFFNHLSFRGGVSKFDNDFKGTPIYPNDSVSRKDLLQRSVYAVGAKLNLIRGFSSPKPKHLFNDLQLNIGYNFLGSRIYDTLMKGGNEIDTTFRTVTQNQLYLEPLLVLNRHRNFSMTLSLPLSFVSVKQSAGIKNDGWEYWLRPSISLMYYGKRDPSSKIFFRYNHHINLKDPKQAFTQMQLGFAVNLTEVWSGKDK